MEQKSSIDTISTEGSQLSYILWAKIMYRFIENFGGFAWHITFSFSINEVRVS